MRQILDNIEFLDWLWMDACRYPGKYPVDADERAKEIRETIEADCTAEYWDLVDDLNEQCPKDKDFSENPSGALRWIEVRLGVLDTIEETLLKYFEGVPIKGALDDALGEILSELEELRAKDAALKAPAIILPDGRALEYDL